MADYRLSGLQSTASALFDDIFHLRTSGGLDKKITLPNLIQEIVSYTEINTATTSEENAGTVNKLQTYRNTGASVITLTLGTSGKTISMPAKSNVVVLYNGTTWYQITPLGITDLSTGDKSIEFASDASILWDESEDLFDYSKGLTIEGVHKKIFANTTNLLLSKDAEDIRTGVTFGILATWVSQFRGSIRLYLQHHSQSGNSVEARVVKNGIQLELWSTTSTGYVTRTYDIIDLIPGDVITWEHRATAISDSYLRYCRIYAEDLIIDTMVIVPNAII